MENTKNLSKMNKKELYEECKRLKDENLKIQLFNNVLEEEQTSSHEGKTGSALEIACELKDDIIKKLKEEKESLEEENVILEDNLEFLQDELDESQDTLCGKEIECEARKRHYEELKLHTDILYNKLKRAERILQDERFRICPICCKDNGYIKLENMLKEKCK